MIIIQVTIGYQTLRNHRARCEGTVKVLVWHATTPRPKASSTDQQQIVADKLVTKFYRYTNQETT